jgi:hypothetical protein
MERADAVATWAFAGTGIARFRKDGGGMMRTFLMGAILGALAMWIWGDQVRARFGNSVDGVVDRALGLVDAVDDQLDALRGRLDSMTTTGGGTRREA